jgi:hypothetical protein
MKDVAMVQQPHGEIVDLYGKWKGYEVEGVAEFFVGAAWKQDSTEMAAVMRLLCECDKL